MAIVGLPKLLGRWSEGSIAVGKVCNLVNDTVHPGDDPAPATEFVGLEHISSHFGTRMGSQPLGDEKGRKFRFAPGDILYGYLRPYLNKIWVADRHGLCSVEQYVLRPNGQLSASLIAHGLRSRSTLDEVISLTHNLQLPRLRSGLLLSLEIPNIPTEAQESAEADLANFMDRVIKVAALKKTQADMATSLRPSLLNAAFNGGI